MRQRLRMRPTITACVMPAVEIDPLECRQPSAKGLFESFQGAAVGMAAVCHKKSPAGAED